MPEPISNTSTYHSKSFYISPAQESETENDSPFSSPNSTVYDPRWTPEMIQKSYDEFLRRYIFTNPKAKGNVSKDPSSDDSWVWLSPDKVAYNPSWELMAAVDAAATLAGFAPEF